MSDKTQEAASCGCAQAEKDQTCAQTCPCNKRICLPVFGLVILALVASVAAKRKKCP